MKKTAFALTIVFALHLALTAGLLVNFGKANFTPLPELPPPVYVRSDGTVDPSTAPIQRLGNTYKLTGNINNTIEIQHSNIIVTGNGYAITKPSVITQGLMIPIGWLPGVHVAGMSNVTITNTTFEGCVTGITADNSSSITLSYNTIKETLCGIVVSSSSNVNIVGNDITLINQTFSTGIQFLPGSPQESVPHHIRIEANRIVGDSNQVPTTAPQPEQYGIWGGFTDSEMTENTLTNIRGIALYNIGANNRIVSNNFIENYEGILINMNQDVWVNNSIYCNNFDHNSENAIVAFIRNPPLNVWDNGTVGNYWSNYTGKDADGDGIGDTPYIIETVYYDYDLQKNVTIKEGEDRFPLMAPAEIPIPSPNQSPTPSPTSPSENPEPFSTMPILVAAVVGVVLAGLGLLVYLRNKKSRVG
jgi:parallel beta-helix repeat protein